MLLEDNELYLFHRMFMLAAACLCFLQSSCEHYMELAVKGHVRLKKVSLK